MDDWDETVLDLVAAAMARAAASDLELPHIVHVYDRLLGVPCAIGPFPDPVTASIFADQYLRELIGEGDDAGVRVNVIALEPAWTRPTADRLR